LNGNQIKLLFASLICFKAKIRRRRRKKKEKEEVKEVHFFPSKGVNKKERSSKIEIKTSKAIDNM